MSSKALRDPFHRVLILTLTRSFHHLLLATSHTQRLSFNCLICPGVNVYHSQYSIWTNDAPPLLHVCNLSSPDGGSRSVALSRDRGVTNLIHHLLLLLLHSSSSFDSLTTWSMYISLSTQIVVGKRGPVLASVCLLVRSSAQ